MPSAPFIQANTNGVLHPADTPSLSPLNRAFLYGDAIYEVWRTYDRVLFAWEEHWARLERSARALYFDLPFSAAQMLEEIRRTCAAYRTSSGFEGELYIRLQVFRSGGPIGLDPALAEKIDYCVLVQPCPCLSLVQIEQGQTLSIATRLRRNPPEALNPAWKTGNYLNNLLCLREAKSRGADEVIILNLAGEITEAAVCNLAFIREGKLFTPPTCSGILEGITRALILQKIAPQAGIRTEEITLYPNDLASMEEVCLLSSTKDIQPVGMIDGQAYKTGSSTVTRQLKTAFADYANEQSARWRAERSV